MKKVALICLISLTIAIPALAVIQNNNQMKTVPRYMSGTMDGRFVFSGPEMGPWTTTGEVVGTLSHFGLSRMVTSHSTDGVTISGGSFTIVAANGDEVRGSYAASGTFAPDFSHVDGVATLTIEGGTGRFAHAEGTIEATFLETFDDPTFAGAAVSWNLSGTILY